MAHKVQVYQCANRSMTAYCRVHAARVFFCDPAFIDELSEIANGTKEIV
jgi:hypothetical protein